MTILSRIFEQAEAHADKPAFIQCGADEDTVYRYRDFINWIRAFSREIGEHGLSPGDRIYLVGENGVRWPAAFFGAHALGLTVALGDSRYTPRELSNTASFIEPSLICCERRFESSFDSAVPRLILEDVSPREEEAPVSPSELPRESPMAVLFTSGTTSEPKGVMLTESNFLSNLAMMNRKPEFLTDRDRVVSILPFHHVYPLTCTVLAPYYYGATFILPHSLQGEAVFGALSRHGGTVFTAIPRILTLLLENVHRRAAGAPWPAHVLFRLLFRLSLRLNDRGEAFGKRVFRSIHRNFKGFRFFTCGGARLDADVHRGLRALGFRVVEAYGLTETAPIAALNSLERPVPGSVGPAAPGVEIDLADRDEKGEGEIRVRGPNVMTGYFKRPDLTNEAIQDGWFKTGDLGRFDAKGNLFVTGRRKEMIVLENGKNIYPGELETVYGESPKIRECCISLVRGPRGEALVAAVVPETDYFVREKIVHAEPEIRFDIENTAQTLPPYQRVRRIEVFSDPLPRTALGKLKRFEVSRMLEECKRDDGGGEGDVSSNGPEDPFYEWIRDRLDLDRVPGPRSRLDQDLDLDSLARLDLFGALEKRFGLRLDDRQALSVSTLGDLCRLLPGEAGKAPDESLSLEEQIRMEPDPPLEQYIDTGNFLPFRLLRFGVHWLCRSVLKLFFRAKIEGLENLEQTGDGIVIAPNHNSLIDGLVIYGILPFRVVDSCVFVSLPQYFGKPPLSRVRRMGRVLLTGTRDTSLASLQYGFCALETGRPLCVFPEGRRSRDGRVKEPRPGIARAAFLAKAAFLPVRIGGSEALFSRKNPGFHFTRIRVNILAPVKAENRFEELLEGWSRSLKHAEKEAITRNKKTGK
jgi:long-chain acyl-CoA synthetase